MYRERESSSREHGSGCGCGCLLPVAALFLAVLGTVAGIGSAVGVGGSVRVPFTDANISAGIGLGDKENNVEVLPNYLEKRVGDDNNFINSTARWNIWKFGITGITVVGVQDEAPVIDLNFGRD